MAQESAHLAEVYLATQANDEGHKASYLALAILGMGNIRQGSIVLTCELVPRTCWWANLRSLLSKSQWQRLRSMVLERASHACEICQSKPQIGSPLHCHEIWSYNDKNRIQKLEDLQALCNRCHEVKHLGYAQVSGRFRQAIDWLAKQNGWTEDEALKYTAAEFKIWRARSKLNWEYDLKVLEQFSLILPKELASTGP